MKRVQMFLAGAFIAVGALYAQSSDAEWQAEVAKLKGTIQTNPAQAAEEAEHLIKGKNKKNVELLVAIGNAYLDADKLPEAQEYATLARKANGKSALASDLQFQVGRLYYGAGTQPDSLTITVEERKQALMSADSVFHAIAEAAPDNSTWVTFGELVPILHWILKPLKDLRNLSMRKWLLYWKAKTILITIRLWLNVTVILDITIC